MNGVEILSSTEVVAESAHNLTAFWAVFGLGSIMTIIICVCLWANEGFSADIIKIVCIGVLISCFIGGVAGIGCATPTSYATEYKVTISDEVLMAEFMNKYEILDQEGKIYTVKEKN
jgi:hypothetical protein